MIKKERKKERGEFKERKKEKRSVGEKKEKKRKMKDVKRRGERRKNNNKFKGNIKRYILCMSWILFEG